jgi:dienelactone hydrolase
MKDKKAITVITTHYDVGRPGDAAAGIHHMRTAGINPAEAEKLQSEAAKASSQKEVADAIAGIMDHGFVYDEENCGNVPHEAINIAQMFGLNEHIIDAAREWMKKGK